jgi:hypothetical protein
MPPRRNAFARLRGQWTVSWPAVIAASTLLAACASSSDGGGKIGSRLFGPKDPNRGVATVQQEYGPEFFLKSDYCPPVEIKTGTEALVTYERNHEQDPGFIQFQGWVTKTARECHATAADTLTVKVGIAGRVVAGPKGGAGSVTLPLRIAVVKQHGGNVLYTEEFKVPVTLAAPDFAADFSQVFDQVVFKVTPDDRDLIVFVGFDQGETAGVTG